MQENKTRGNTTKLVLFKNVRNTDKKYVGNCTFVLRLGNISDK